jgi:transposase InsO family protein
MPRQAYGIDFYDHEQGEILVAVDLCTREATLWFLTNRKQDNFARALLTGLIFQTGVPLSFRNDEAPEFVRGVVAAMKRYLGIQQITTGSHNPRSNAVVERFMQHLNACLSKCDDSQYKSMRDYLPAIVFAHNTVFNSAINCTPFEAGHGLSARTITEARANPRLQITAEEGTDIQEPDNT